MSRTTNKNSMTNKISMRIAFLFVEGFFDH